MIRRMSSDEYDISPMGNARPYQALLPLPSVRNGQGHGANGSSHKSHGGRNGNLNKLGVADQAAHDWYRFVLSYPPHLVRQYLDRFCLKPHQRVLDPFCGTGTTVVECRKRQIPSVGIEANAMAYFATRTKVNWSVNPEGLLQHARKVAAATLARLREDGIQDEPNPMNRAGSAKRLHTLDPELMDLLLTNSMSPLPLHKTLVLLACLEEHRSQAYDDHERLALAKSLVYRTSNLHFGPEVGVGTPKADAPVVSEWLSCVGSMSRDIVAMREIPLVRTEVLHADSRDLGSLLEPESVDAVITSPPYPNEKDYTRTTRLESVLLGFIKNKTELQSLKRSLVRSNTRGVYKGDDDDQWISMHPEIQSIADAIEARRLELGKTSGFERLYPRVTKLYFGGMARHLAQLKTVLRPGARLAYVVGDQASYLRVMIRTGELLAKIGASLGYEVIGIDLFRTRLATATKAQLREEVVLLQWPGEKKPRQRRRKG